MPRDAASVPPPICEKAGRRFDEATSNLESWDQWSTMPWRSVCQSEGRKLHFLASSLLARWLVASLASFDPRTCHSAAHLVEHRKIFARREVPWYPAAEPSCVQSHKLPLFSMWPPTCGLQPVAPPSPDKTLVNTRTDHLVRAACILAGSPTPIKNAVTGMP